MNTQDYKFTDSSQVFISIMCVWKHVHAFCCCCWCCRRGGKSGANSFTAHHHCTNIASKAIRFSMHNLSCKHRLADSKPNIPMYMQQCPDFAFRTSFRDSFCVVLLRAGPWLQQLARYSPEKGARNKAQCSLTLPYSSSRAEAMCAGRLTIFCHGTPGKGVHGASVGTLIQAQQNKRPSSKDIEKP